MISVEEINAAYTRIKGIVHETPIISSEKISEIAGCEVVFKCEHLQKTGSFKARGAMNATVLQKENKNIKGVITHSSGNHGQGLAWAARQLNLPCTVVVPKNAPTSKADAMKAYGANIVFCDNSIEAREQGCYSLSQELGYGIVEPFNAVPTINGQGTIAIELLQQVPDLNAVFVAVGGGGLASGISKYLGELRPDIRVYLVEPEGKNLAAYLETSEFGDQKNALNTIADGIRVHKVGDLCFQVLKQFCERQVITVSENDIRFALGLVWTRTKQRVEPAAGVALAGLLKTNVKALGIKKAAVILCGGNVDLDFMP